MQPPAGCGLSGAVLVVVDTNIWISAALSPQGDCGPIVDLVLSRRVTPVTCPSTLREITLVLTRTRFVERYAIAPPDVAQLLTAPPGPLTPTA